jgi:hypothetical protein
MASNILRSFEAVLPWVILIPFATTCLGHHRMCARYDIRVLTQASHLLA